MFESRPERRFRSFCKLSNEPRGYQGTCLQFPEAILPIAFHILLLFQRPKVPDGRFILYKCISNFACLERRIHTNPVHVTSTGPFHKRLSQRAGIFFLRKKEVFIFIFQKIPIHTVPTVCPISRGVRRIRHCHQISKVSFSSIVFLETKFRWSRVLSSISPKWTNDIDTLSRNIFALTQSLVCEWFSVSIFQWKLLSIRMLVDYYQYKRTLSGSLSGPILLQCPRFYPGAFRKFREVSCIFPGE